MTEVLRALLAGAYQAGLSHHEALGAPSAADHRWAGLCAFNLGQPLRARDLLLQARAAGATAANIELATVARQLGELAEARGLLERLSPAVLTPFDRALYWRELSLQRFGADDLLTATEAAEAAWACTFDAPHGGGLRPGIGLCLGLVYAARGHDRRAETYLSAALETATPGRGAYLHMVRAACRSRAGHHGGARDDLAAASLLAPQAPGIGPVLAYHLGAAAWALGALDEAAAWWAQAATAAGEACEPETECYAQLGLAAVATVRADLTLGRRYLARAGVTAVTPVATALLTLRRGALAARGGESAARDLLTSARDALLALQRTREAGWAELHLAEHLLATGSIAGADELLGAATDRRHALGCGAALVPELRGLGRVRAYLASRPAGHYLRALWDDALAGQEALPFDLRLITLGEARLLVDGRPARLDLARSLEMLAFMLRRPGQTMSQIAATLSPDEDPKRAKNYLHQARYDLARGAPGLTLAHDADRGYRVRWGGVTLSWDVWDVEAALGERSEAGMNRALALYAGSFLPAAEGTWVSEERSDMAWSVVKVGLELIEEWYVQREFAKCVALAGRLLEVDPYDEPLAEYLVKAARALNGDVAARRAVNRLVARHVQEMGSAPTSLLGLQSELNMMN